MKFRRLILILMFATVVIAFFTKPGKDDFITYIQPMIARTGEPPVVDYQDNFLYAKVVATFVNTQAAATEGQHTVAPAGKVEYIGVFKKFWKLGN